MLTNAKKTKIVATIGPVSENEETLLKMAKAGLNVARLNFSHGNYAEHLAKIKMVRKVSKALDKPMAILADLAGPKIRIGDFKDGKIFLKKGAKFTLTVDDIMGDESIVSINCKDITLKIKKGDFVMLEDGSKKLEVDKVSGNNVFSTVIVGGELKSKKGVNLPGVSVGISALTAKDKKDLEFALKHDVDFVALSFVKKGEDVKVLKKIIEKSGSSAGVIAKIETKEAVSKLDEIIDEAYGVMVARGDLGIEVPLEEVPLIQKMIIKKCNEKGKPVITATQVLESMIKNPRPTRAEVSDIANAVLDGTDAIMLSEETALGAYPVEAIETMASVCRHTEKSFPYEQVLKSISDGINLSVVDSISASVCRTAYRLDAKLIVVFTSSGSSARMISRWRPKQPVLALTHDEKVRNMMALSFGTFSKKIKNIKDHDAMIDVAKEEAAKTGLVKKGDKIVISAGIPFGSSGTTNLILVQVV
ncbi:MAG: pyruvate kinase [Parcubacteria group bacterium]|nr:pyruvate kinase [Parcubacteria group bacterium]MCR4342365.1 pyruvate kinase [Patescibacteria group bacterium]